MIVLHDDSEKREPESLGGAPDTPSPQGEMDDLRARCAHDRDAMTPRETADCAGTDLAEQYENEEDGGS